MSVSRPARCLLSGPTISRIRPRMRCQNFHSSPNVCERRKPNKKRPSISAADMGLINSKIPAREIFPAYTPEQMELLKELYTPAQIKAIEAGEAAVNPEDLKSRGVIRTDYMSVDYLDDFSKTHPVLDRPKEYEGPVDPNPNLMTLSEAEQEMDRAFRKFQKQHKAPPPAKTEGDVEHQQASFPTRIEMMQIEDEASLLIGHDGRHIPNYKNTKLLAPRLPKDFLTIEEPSAMFLSPEETKKAKDKAEKQKMKEKAAEEPDPRDPDGVYNVLLKQTGMTLSDVFSLTSKVLVRHRVSNQTRLGKIGSVYCLAIAGDGKGRLGLGQAKGQEPDDTANNAIISAIRAMQYVPRYEERTIYGDVEAKMSASVVKLMARPPGFGLRCQHLIYEMARAAGIFDLSARVERSRNPMNTVKATYKALMAQRIPEEIAKGRGKKLVDVRKVYYAGKV